MQLATFEAARLFYENAPNTHTGLIDPKWVVQGLREMEVPKRNLFHHISALTFIGMSTLEALLSNKPRHYATPGRTAPENRLWSFDRLSNGLREFKNGRATHQAVNRIYHHSFGSYSDKSWQDTVDAVCQDLTFGTDHALGLICRFRIIETLMRRLLASGKVRLLGSIACGAADATISAINAAAYRGKEIHTGFFDINEAALNSAENTFSGIMRQRNPNLGRFFLTNVLKNQNWFSRLPMQGLELTGLIDYIPNDKLPGFLRSLRNPELKFLVTCNILKKPGFTGWYERLFIKHALQWPMYLSLIHI